MLLSALPTLSVIALIWLVSRYKQRKRPKQMQAPQREAEPLTEATAPIDARTLRRYTPKGTRSSDFVIPCPACGFNTAMPRTWVLENDTFICPRCDSSTHLIKSANSGEGAITDELERIKKLKPKH